MQRMLRPSYFARSYSQQACCQTAVSLLRSASRNISSLSSIIETPYEVPIPVDTRSAFSNHVRSSLAKLIEKDNRVKCLHLREFSAGEALAQSSEFMNDAQPRLTNSVVLVKLCLRTTGPFLMSNPSPTAGTDVGMEIWLPEHDAWNKRLQVRIQGGFMGDAAVTNPHDFATSPCGSDEGKPLGVVAADLGYVVATTDGGHVASTYEDMSYLMNDDGSINREGWKNIAWQATLLTKQVTQFLSSTVYGQKEKASYFFGCSTGGRQGYHIAKRFPDSFDGYLIGCPSITQSLLFPSLVHPHIVINNDLGGKHFKPGQLEMVSRKALAAGDSTVTGSHDGFVTHWADNRYDPTKDHDVISVEDGGKCTAPWALSLQQANAINKIWYGPTMDGSCPSPDIDNGAGWDLSHGQIWWGKIRGTRIDFSEFPRHVAGGMLAVTYRDVSLASSLWNHALGRGQNSWRSFTYEQFAEAMLKCRSMDSSFENMDAGDPDLREAQKLGKKILVYHGLADTGVAPQSAVRYLERSARLTGGHEETTRFHRLFLIPGMGHCIRYRGCAGSTDPPLPKLEEMFEALVRWTEDGIAPQTLQAVSVDGKSSRDICLYPQTPTYIGGNVLEASNFRYL